MDTRSAREWLADMLDAASHRVRPSTAVDKPVELQTLAELQARVVPLRPLWNVPPPPGDDRPAVCGNCPHERAQHHAGRGRCMLCVCQSYTGPWPVDHLHVTTERCEDCGQPGLHWAVRMGQRLVLYPSSTGLPGELPGRRSGDWYRDVVEEDDGW